MDYGRNVKVNSRYEFPHDLNLEPYTVEGLEWRAKKAKEQQLQLNKESSTEPK